MKEIWKDVPDYESYQVSNLGRVKTKYRVFKRSNNIKLTVKSKIKVSHYSKEGYEIVSLSKNNKTHNKQIHQLVAIAFLGHKPCGFDLVVDHIDEDKSNNHVSNLQILTNRDNCVKSMNKEDMSSKYIGVTLHKSSGKYQASIKHKSKSYYLGHYTKEIDASKAYKKALKQILNGEKVTKNPAKSSSKYKGVSFTKQKSRGKIYEYWIAYQFVDKKRINLGCYKTEILAYQAVLDFKKQRNVAYCNQRKKKFYQ